MTAERLLRQFERIADAPDAIGRLRRFVLDLAVRGSLAAPDPGDEPADALLDRLLVERDRRIAEGTFSEPTSVARLDRDWLPFTPPSHWRWARLIDIARPAYGCAFASGQFNSAKRGMPLIRIRDISSSDTEAYFDGEFDPSYLVNAGDYLVGMDGDFNLRRWRGKLALLNQRVLRINEWRCSVEPEFIKIPLQFVLDHLHAQTSQTTVKHLSAKQVNAIEIPLPPIAEQHRIVAKVDELMALCDRLEAVRAEREAARDRLTTVSLARLNTPDPETFSDDARFALDSLPSLTARAEQVIQLRQTILSLAVRGRLVAQDPTEAPAAELLQRIATGKAQRRQATGDARIKLAPDPDPADLPMPLPSGWAVQSFENLFLFIDYRGNTPPKTTDGIPLITAKNVRMGHLNREPREFISAATFRAWMTRGFPAGRDLFFTTEAPLANVCLNDIDEPFALAQRVICLQPYGEVNTKFLMFVLMSDLMQSLIDAHATGLTAKGIKAAKLKPLPIPIAPLAEQQRIVTKVDELMALCGRLEVAIGARQEHQRRLLEALLHEALEPAVMVEAVA